MYMYYEILSRYCCLTCGHPHIDWVAFDVEMGEANEGLREEEGCS